MPDDVAQRLESALRDAAASPGAAVGEPVAVAVSVLPAGQSGRRGSRRGSGSGLPNFSVAAAVTVFVVIALGVGLGVGLSGGGQSSKSSSAGSAASATGSIVIATGTDYTQDSIRNQVAGLVLARVPDAPTQYKGLGALAAAVPSTTPSRASSAAAGGAPAPSAAPEFDAGKSTAHLGADNPASGRDQSSAPALAARSPFSGPLGDPAKLRACVEALLNQPGTPLLVDYAYYAGKPATIIVLKDPADPSTLDVYVESGTADCANDLTLVTYLHNVS
jgi:hypothetical protein